MTFTSLRHALQAWHPIRITPEGCHQASVAMLLCELEHTPNMFFIQRALHQNDPWSGQIAFPGGSRDPEDLDTLYTAQRETKEEVGICLENFPLLGQLDDQKSYIRINSKPVVINCYVFEVPETVKPINSEEVHDSFWIPINHLINPENKTVYSINRSDEHRPAIQLDDRRVLWGLTYRFVTMLIDRISQN
ncbi:MAG: CoA pyrophosphatase [Gammaproteobacteria bacterium]|nr:CoA pyrophosphatase [Gammaproteobacteria bacterium]MCY4275325.1 CoA pyrophosphatase [Gammaproteobacteria bacterium]